MTNGELSFFMFSFFKIIYHYNTLVDLWYTVWYIIVIIHKCDDPWM